MAIKNAAFSRAGRAGVAGVVALLLTGCFTVNSYTTLTAAREPADQPLTEEERLVALEIAKAVAAAHGLKATQERSRLPVSYGDGEIWIEVWAKEKPARVEFMITDFNTPGPSKRGKEVRRTIESLMAERLPAYSVRAEHKQTVEAQ